MTQQAINSWQSRAQQAAQALGFASWRPGHVTVQTGDGGRVYPVMRAQAAGLPRRAGRARGRDDRGDRHVSGEADPRAAKTPASH